MNSTVTGAETAKKRIKRGACIVLGLFVLALAAFLFYPADSLETTSPDGRLDLYATYSDVVLPDFSDGWVRVADLKTGEIVDATKIEGGLFGHTPQTLTWSADGRHFIYIYMRELGYTLRAFDVKTSPLRVQDSDNEKAKQWVTVLLKQQIKVGNAEEKERAQGFLERDLFY